MLTRTKAALTGALVLASASAAFAQNQYCDGIPNVILPGQEWPYYSPTDPRHASGPKFDQDCLVSLRPGHRSRHH
jgi:hypothetical protein